jgi:chaperonin GroEL
MGPTGRNVIIDKSFGGPTVTKDGVTVAKEIELEDRFENMGAKLVMEVAQKTSDLAGDGTTTATVLARAIFKEGLKNIVAGAIRQRFAAESSEPSTRPRPNWSRWQAVSEKSEVANVGAISANNDMHRRAVGRRPGTGRQRRRDHGRRRQDAETNVEYVDGMQFDKGFISPYFINDPSDDGVRI